MEFIIRKCEENLNVWIWITPLGSELKKQTGIIKDQYKFFKYQINVLSRKREDGVKAGDVVKIEDGEIINSGHHKYIRDEYKTLIGNNFSYELMDGDLRQPNFDNRHLDLTNIAHRCLERNVSMSMKDCLILRNP